MTPTDIKADREARRLAAYRRTVAKRSKEPKAQFLKHYRKHCTVLHSCEAIGVDPSTIYAWREADAAFAEAMDACREWVIESLERVAIDRARSGLSDRLVVQLLKALKPKLYNPPTQANTTSLNVNATLDADAIKQLSDADLETARRVVRQLRAPS